MKLFWLNRKQDVSGVSGTGIVAEGVEFSDGQCVVSWLGTLHSKEFHLDIATVMAIHGHGGATELIWAAQADEEPKVH